jgi:F-type H+-transporting ATPase subunit alpha
MSIKASEISDLIKARIDKFKSASEARNVGTVVSVTDGIVRVHGLADARYGEMLEFVGNTFGLALNLEQDSVGAVVLGDYKHISEGSEVKTTGRILEVPVGPELLGRVVDALGTPIDGKGPVNAKLKSPLERVAPGVIFRKSVSQPVQTGLKARNKVPSPMWCASSRSTARWRIPSSLPLRPRRRRPCNILRLMADAPWASTSWTAAKTP